MESSCIQPREFIRGRDNGIYSKNRCINNIQTVVCKLKATVTVLSHYKGAHGCLAILIFTCCKKLCRLVNAHLLDYTRENNTTIISQQHQAEKWPGTCTGYTT